MTESSIIFTNTPLGLMWLWSTPRGLCGAGYGSCVGNATLRRLARYGIETPKPVSSALLEQARRQLLAYFDWHRHRFSLPLDLRGTDFQLAVWERLQGVPYGETTTYGEIAMLLGNLRASQAVGQAVGANPTTIFVPCHRVLGYDGGLTGYAAGVERKAALLELEHAGLQLRMPFVRDDVV
ncbi:MAG: methylated-DNA--[protein]-cysteine S-methyltransferase [Anaerolineae bacterium]